MGGLNNSPSVKVDGAKAPESLPLGASLLLVKRRAMGLEQPAFIEAFNLNVSQASYSRWERGVSKVPFEVLVKLGVVRAVPLDEIRQGVSGAQ